MDRQTAYPFQIPYETDFLYAARFAYEAMGLALVDLLGTTTLVAGLACAPTSPASLSATIAPGRIYSFQFLEPTSWGNVGAVGGLGSDTNADHKILKQGVYRNTTTFNFPAPGTTGQSINYLVQATFTETDTNNQILPFFNSSSPASPWSGPNNTGTSLPTVRTDLCTVSVKAGMAATTGTQTTPAPDSGNVGLWVVTVANGQATVTSGNISAYSPSSFITETLTQKISQATADLRYQQLSPGSLLSHGQCYFRFVSATQVNLAPRDGNGIIVNGVQKAIPSSGITAANTGVTVNGTPTSNLAASTVYLVAMNSAGALEFWSLATGHSTDTTAGNVGVEVITGHADKTLVGMVSTNASSQFFDDNAQIGVLSWFNRMQKGVTQSSGSDQSIASSSLAPLTSFNVLFLCWSEDTISHSASGSFSVSGNTATKIAINIDVSNSGGPAGGNPTPGTSIPWGFSFSWAKRVSNDGQHTAYLLADSITANTVTIPANTTTHSIIVRG